MEHTAPPSNRINENRQEEPGRGGSLQNADRSGGRAADSGGDREVSRGGWRRLLGRAGDRKDFPKVWITLLAVVLAAAFALAVILVILALAFSFCLPDQA